MEEDKVLWALMYVVGFGFVATILRVLFKRIFDNIDKKFDTLEDKLKSYYNHQREVESKIQKFATREHVDSEIKLLHTELNKVALKCHEVLRDELAKLQREISAAHDKQTDRLIELASKGK